MGFYMSQGQAGLKSFNEYWVWCEFQEDFPHTTIDEYGRSFGPYPKAHKVLMPIELGWILVVHNIVKPTKIKECWMIPKNRHTFGTNMF